MQDVSGNTSSLRTAKGIAVLRLDKKGYEKLKENALLNRDWRESVRLAAYLGAKNTSALLPQCHSVSLDGFEVDFVLLAPGESMPVYPDNTHFVAVITGAARSVGRKGVEMEVLTGLSIAAMSLYDLMKSLSEDLEVVSVRLLPGEGKKPDKPKQTGRRYRFGVLFCADKKRVEKGDDAAGQLALEILKDFNIELVEYAVLPLEVFLIEEKLEAWVREDVHFILTIGGTGPGKQDVVPQLLSQMVDKSLPGLTAAIYQHGFERSSKAMLSTLAAGVKEESILLSLPGSTSGLRESMEAILPEIFSFRKMIKGASK